MRLSEVCGLIGSLNLETGLPNCVEIEPTLNGLFEAFYITGHIYKRRHIPQKHRWAAGLRSAGSTELPPAILAIKRLHQLLEPWRDLARPDDPTSDQTLHNQLLVRFRYIREFPRNRDGMAPILARLLAQQMKSWLFRHGKVPADVNIPTPAWRKSYALQTYMIDPQLLPAISRHFGHVSEMITYSSYVEGADPELERYRDDVAYNEVAQFMAAVRRGEIQTAGKIPEAIVANRQNLDAHFASLSESEIIDAMTDELRKSNIRGFGAPWGICIYRREWSRCEGTTCGPNFEKRNTETCCSCANLVMLERHYDFWQDRKAKTEKSLAEFSAFEPGAGIIPVLKARLAQSDKILNALKVAA
ncbi:hypothetical protein GCM10011611_24970 [Aliidongia dinghuensis]|uniref:Tyr recombinase domain-containing protein n=2 Tax=Aliidongia dinghuensis TaxID=1867774 RepID=A0A8J2YUV0_9PROT|nr:hypothetical protein GCM10011611_24970 [Aliidongia dinghuensis]